MERNASIIRAIRSDLRDCVDPVHREGVGRFFKEQINPLGVRTRDLSAVVSRSWRLVRAMPPQELLGLCDALWASGVFEEASVACKLCARALPALDAPAFSHFEHWLHTRVDNWAHCDDLCSHCIGGLLPAYPDLLARTLPWLASPNRWVRRGAAVCCVKPARHGLYLAHAFHVADALIEDTDDMVRKGFGWLLKEASRAWPREVLEFAILRSDRMPRGALRTAIELMPPEWRQKAMRTRTPASRPD